MTIQLPISGSPVPAEKMEPQAASTIITLPVSCLLLQLATDLRRKNSNLSVTIPTATTWEAVMRATQSAFREQASTTMAIMPHTEAQQQSIRQLALKKGESSQPLPPSHGVDYDLSPEYYQAYKAYVKCYTDQIYYHNHQVYLQYHLDYNHPERANTKIATIIAGIKIFTIILFCGIACIVFLLS
jgi:hypothetical protein